jgi:hypothetical protein
VLKYITVIEVAGNPPAGDLVDQDDVMNEPEADMAIIQAARQEQEDSTARSSLHDYAGSSLKTTHTISMYN